MTQRWLIALLTAIGFAAGFGARMMTESGPAVPPPPAPGSEFVRSANATPASEGKEERRAPTYSDKDRAKLLADIDSYRKQIDVYRKQIDLIAADFERDLVPLLNDQQRAKFAEMKKHSAERHAKGEKEAAETTVLSDEQIFRLQQSPLWNALWNVAINWRLERLNRDFKLDDAQQAKVRELLARRREKFLALVDSSPPPSITLSQLAPQAEKLASAAKK